jgi:hypothetical protein
MRWKFFTDETSLIDFIYREAQFLHFMPYSKATSMIELAQVCKDSVINYYGGQGVMMTGLDQLTNTNIIMTRVYIPHTINMAWAYSEQQWYIEIEVLV